MSVYNSPGWKMKPKEFELFTAVTASNRKNAVIMGRVLYVIEKVGSMITYRGYIVVRPRLVKGRVSVKQHPFLPDHGAYINEDEDFDSYRDSFNKIITLKISENQLFFKLTDKLVKYDKD